MADIPSHHFIYGTCLDFVTGEELVDTDDERIRQELFRLLVEEKGYGKEQLEPRLTIETLFAKQFVVSKIDLVVKIDGRRLLLLRYGPGSLVSRERSAIAAARVLDPEQRIPMVVVTNGQDAEFIDTLTGTVLGTGMAAIPWRDDLVAMANFMDFSPYPEENRERELRILNAYDVEVCCAGSPCALPEAPEG